MFLVLSFLVSILQTAHLWANTGVVFRELSFSRLECGVHDRLHIYPLCGVFYFPWHRHQIEGTNGFYCLIRKTERFTISNVESQVFTPNNSRLPRGLNAGGPRPKRVSYHWTTPCVAVNSLCKMVTVSYASLDPDFLREEEDDEFIRLHIQNIQ